MSEYESLREDMAEIAASFGNYARTVNDHAAHANRQIKRLWEDNAELRDELVAVSNRLENLTRAVTTSPAEVAEAMVQPYPMCRCGHRHDHHRHHDPERCYRCDSCRGYNPRPSEVAERGFIRLAADLKDEPA